MSDIGNRNNAAAVIVIVVVMIIIIVIIIFIVIIIIILVAIETLKEKLEKNGMMIAIDVMQLLLLFTFCRSKKKVN